MPVTLSSSEREFIDRLGLIGEQGGLTRVTGRIWGLLIVSGEALPPANIAETLEISRGSVSMSLKTLEGFDLLTTSAKPGDRQTYFGMRAHPYSAFVRMLMKQSTTHAGMVRDALKSIDRPEARQRLNDLATFYEILEDGYQLMLDKMSALDSR